MVICFICTSLGTATIFILDLLHQKGRSKLTSVRLYSSTYSSNKCIATVIVTPDVKFCIPSSRSDFLFAAWLPLLGFEILLCGLALYKGYQTYQLHIPHGLSMFTISAFLIKDSILYFVVLVYPCSTIRLEYIADFDPCRMFLAYMANAMVWLAGGVSAANYSYIWCVISL